MQATFETVTVIGRVLGFDIMEVWISDGEELRCLFIHATDNVVFEYPEIVTGHFPKLKSELKLSLSLCELANQSASSFIWRTIDDIEENDMVNNEEAGPQVLHTEFRVPVKTEMAYKIDGTVLGSTCLFIVGLAMESVRFHNSSLKYLSGVGFALSVAVFDLDDEAINFPQETPIEDAELDGTNFMPRQYSIANLSELQQGYEQADSNQENSEVQASSADVDNTPELSVGAQDKRSSLRSTNISEQGGGGENSYINRVITDNFSFPVNEIPVVMKCPTDMSLNDIKSMKHITDGSNSNIFHGILRNQQVIVKILKETEKYDPIAQLEFDVEFAMLCRIDHPNILHVLGCGQVPRKFIVLEYMSGGTLYNLLNQEKKAKRFVLPFFKPRPVLTFINVLKIARDLASALDYLHSRCHPGATVIHRDLKPDNIAFTQDGKLKLIDFGLCTCVKTRQSCDEAYEMTGFTGSLRYMAPEVALRRPYTEKADIYSFAIIAWQMAKDKSPYSGFTRALFLENVALKGERPKLDRSMPIAFCNLLEACWDADPNRRPPFSDIITELNTMIDNIENPRATKDGKRSLKVQSILSNTSTKTKSSSQSNWF